MICAKLPQGLTLSLNRAMRMHIADNAAASCPSVRLSQAGILSKWLGVDPPSSNFFTIGYGVPTPLYPDSTQTLYQR